MRRGPGDTVYIPLRANRRLGKQKFALVDMADVERVLWACDWRAEAASRTFYAVAGSMKRLPAHHQRMQAFIVAAEPGVRFDHINGDGLDNCRDNLRLATSAENSRNRRKTNAWWVTSRFKGVHMTASGRWAALIVVDGVQHDLGRFVAEIDAALAYDDAAPKFHGSFAKTNRALGLFEETVPADLSARSSRRRKLRLSDVLTGETHDRLDTELRVRHGDPAERLIAGSPRPKTA